MRFQITIYNILCWHTPAYNLGQETLPFCTLAVLSVKFFHGLSMRTELKHYELFYYSVIALPVKSYLPIKPRMKTSLYFSHKSNQHTIVLNIKGTHPNNSAFSPDQQN